MSFAGKRAVENWEERHTAEKAHIAHDGKITEPLDDGKSLDGKYAETGVGYPQSDNLPRFEIQAAICPKKPAD